MPQIPISPITTTRLEPPVSLFSIPKKKKRTKNIKVTKKKKTKDKRKYIIEPTLANLLFNKKRRTAVKVSTGFELLRV